MAVASVAVFDLDGTISRRDTYVEFLLYCLSVRPGRLVQLPALAAYLLVHKLGFRSNHWLKARYLKAVAGGLSRAELTEICDKFIVRTLKHNIKPGAVNEIARLTDEGYRLILATASFDLYVMKLAQQLGFKEVLCSKAAFDKEGRLSGEIDGRNCISEEKAAQITELLRQRDWQAVDVAYSDSAVDWPMLELATVALVIDPKPATAKLAAEKGYRVIRWR